LKKKLRNLSLGLKERTMTVLKLAEGPGLNEAGVKVLEDIMEQRAATMRHGIRRTIVG